MKQFALIGAAGYIAPRHMQAISETGNILSAAYDKNDSAGIIDSYFPEAAYFIEFEAFQAHIDKMERANKALDFISIASPNYLHDAHMRFALKSGLNAICEKPLVLNPEEIEGLLELQEATGGNISTILQLRLHPVIVDLQKKIASSQRSEKYDVDLTYITSRGDWYMQSWKADIARSGGIATNIGVHFFDMLHFLFGELQASHVHLSSPMKSAGFLEYKNARVRWFLSIDSSDVPQIYLDTGQRTYRSITIDGEEIEFSGGFTDLHTRSYEEILLGNGFGLEDNRAAISTVAGIRGAQINRKLGDLHPFVRLAEE